MFLFIVYLCHSFELDFIPSARTPPSARSNSFMTYLKSRNSLILFGGLSSNINCNDLWEFSLDSNTWKEIIPLSNDLPAGRKSLGGAGSESGRKIFIFGGQTAEGHENDLWEFDFDYMKWVKKLMNVSPAPRSFFAYTSYKEGNDEFLVIEGGSSTGGHLNDMWRLNFSNFEWTLMPADGEGPKLSKGSVLLYYQRTLLLAVGAVEDGFGCSHYLYSYSLDQLKWQVISNRNSTFKCRYLCQGFVYNDQIFILFGWMRLVGQVATDVLKFDLKSNDKNWEEVELFSEISTCEYSLVIINETFYLFGGFAENVNTYTNQFDKVNMNSLEVSSIHKSIVFPKQRSLHSMVMINKKFYVFGGVYYDKIFNDLWVFNLSDNQWSQISVKGAIPSPRYLYASCADGDAFIIWGGEDSIGLKNDMFLFNSLTNTWIEIITSSQKPRPAKGSCLVFKDYKVYLYGGKTDSELSKELWVYYIGANKFHLLSDTQSPEAFYHSCWLESNLFYVSLGSSKSNEPLRKIHFFNLTSLSWSVFHDHVYSFEDSSQSLQLFIDNHLIRIGGQAWAQYARKYISILGPGKEMKVNPKNLPFPIFGAASVYFKRSLYVFGGGTGLDDNLLEKIGHNLFFEIDVGPICVEGGFKALCSSGTWDNNGICEACPQGSYSEKLGQKNCDKCKPGSYNEFEGSASSQQCLPCPEGTFNGEFGAAFCIPCPDDSFCPIGSDRLFESHDYHSSQSVQPLLYENMDLEEPTIIFQTLVSVPLFLLIIILFSFKKLRAKIHKLDIFEEKHENPYSDYMIRKKTKIGACFTILLVISILLTICSLVLEYFQANIQESKALVNLVVLESENVRFESNIIVEVSFPSYGGQCESSSKCDDSIYFNISNINYTDHSISCKLLESKSCKIQIIFKKVEIETGAKISISLTERFSFSSGVEVNLTSGSSIPDKISSVVSVVRSETDYILIGAVASEFYFIATPSLFKSESSRWASQETGYHVSQKASPFIGSQFRAHDLPSVSYLNLNIFIDKSLTGLLTQRHLKQNFLFFVGSLLGTISGLFGIVGFVMVYFEKFVKKCVEKWTGKNAMVTDDCRNPNNSKVDDDCSDIGKTVSNEKSLY